MEEIKKLRTDLKIEIKENIKAIKDEIREDAEGIKKDLEGMKKEVRNMKGQWKAERVELRKKIDDMEEKNWKKIK